MTPATPTTAFPLGSKLADPLEMYLSDVFTVTANLAGVPGLVVPAGSSNDGLPLGLQLLGRHYDETTLLAAGKVMAARAEATARSVTASAVSAIPPRRRKRRGAGIMASPGGRRRRPSDRSP